MKKLMGVLLASCLLLISYSSYAIKIIEKQLPIRVAFFYTNDTLAAVGNNLSNIQLLQSIYLSAANRALRNNSIPVAFESAGLFRIGDVSNNSLVSDAALYNFANNSDVLAIRNKYQADLSVLMGKAVLIPQTDGSTDYVLGKAMIPFDKNGLSINSAGRSFSVVAADYYIPLVLAHELGHNLGLVHPDSALNEGIYYFGHGYKQDSVFATVMAYPDENTPHIALFSNPNRTYGGFPTGNAVSNAELAINKIYYVVGQYAEVCRLVPSSQPLTAPYAYCLRTTTNIKR